LFIRCRVALLAFHSFPTRRSSDLYSNNFDIAIALFGMNPIFGMQANGAQPLLQKLDNVGTLFIKNIHFLDMETQEYLAMFMRYGDRKSTRVNSSHVKSSYAVLCLQ